MIRRAVLIGLAVLLLMMLAKSALAADCTTTAEAANKALAEGAGETPRMSGISQAGELVIVYGNKHTGTWTILLVSPDGCARILTFGQSYADVLRGVAG